MTFKATVDGTRVCPAGARVSEGPTWQRGKALCSRREGHVAGEGVGLGSRGLGVSLYSAIDLDDFLWASDALSV